MPRIVLIDDETRLLQTLAKFLELRGFEVVTGTSFSAVEATLQPGHFDVLITDILMPEKHGLDVLREVAEVRGCQEPVLLMTGQPNIESAAEAVRRGAFDYISKPVTKDKLNHAVDRALRTVQLLRERDRALRKEMDILRSLALLGEQSSLISHEVRAPITALRQALRAVADKIGIEDKVLVGELIAQLEQIERLLGRALSFAKPLDLKLTSVDVRKVLEDAIEQVSAIPAVAGMACELDCAPQLPVVEADPQLLGEVFVNLLRNAGEACGGKGQVDIAAWGAGGQVIIEVTDDGPGVDPDVRDEIFLPFRSFKDGGTGIGLAFCRKILEAHGGSLDLVDRPGLGACFRVAFTARAAHPAQAPR